MPYRDPALLYLRVPQFEAAVQQALQPSLRGRPVVVASSFRALGRVLAASAEAGSEGIEPGMTVKFARERCPDAKWFTPDAELQERAMRALFTAAAACSPLVERAGRGSLFVDVAGTERLFGRSVDLASRLQHEVKEQYRLPNALGLSRRRVWSALAERFAEPEGVFAVLPGLEEGFLDLVAPAWLDGIGPKTIERLQEMNITRMGQLRQFDRETLLDVFGPAGHTLADALDPMTYDEPVRSLEESLRFFEAGDRIEASAALHEDTVAIDALRAVVHSLVTTVAGHLRMRRLGAARLHLRVFYNDGRSATRQAKLPGIVQNETVLCESAERLLVRLHQRRVRLSRLWLRAERLGPPERQLGLFESSATRKDEPLTKSLDRIRERFGLETIRTGTSLLHGAPSRPRLSCRN